MCLKLEKNGQRGRHLILTFDDNLKNASVG